MERLTEIVRNIYPLIILAKRSILNVWQGSEYAYGSLPYSLIHPTQKLCGILFNTHSLVCEIKSGIIRATNYRFWYSDSERKKEQIKYLIRHWHNWTLVLAQCSLKAPDKLCFFNVYSPVGKERKLNVHKTFKRRPGSCLLNVFCMFNLLPVSTGRRCRKRNWPKWDQLRLNVQLSFRNIKFLANFVMGNFW